MEPRRSASLLTNEWADIRLVLVLWEPLTSQRHNPNLIFIVAQHLLLLQRVSLNSICSLCSFIGLKCTWECLVYSLLLRLLSLDSHLHSNFCSFEKSVSAAPQLLLVELHQVAWHPNTSELIRGTQLNPSDAATSLCHSRITAEALLQVPWRLRELLTQNRSFPSHCKISYSIDCRFL